MDRFGFHGVSRISIPSLRLSEVVAGDADLGFWFCNTDLVCRLFCRIFCESSDGSEFSAVRLGLDGGIRREPLGFNSNTHFYCTRLSAV